MIGLGNLVQRWWFRKFHPLVRVGLSSARTALRENDLRRLALSLAIAAVGHNRRRTGPKLVYSASIDTDESFVIRAKRGRRPIAETTVNR